MLQSLIRNCYQITTINITTVELQDNFTFGVDLVDEATNISTGSPKFSKYLVQLRYIYFKLQLWGWELDPYTDTYSHTCCYSERVFSLTS